MQNLGKKYQWTGKDAGMPAFFSDERASCKSMSCGSTGSPRTGKVVRQDHHEWINQDTVTLSRELAERSKGVFGVLQEAREIRNFALSRAI